MIKITFTDFEAFWFNRFIDRGLLGIKKTLFQKEGISENNGYDISFVKYNIDQSPEEILNNAIANDPVCIFVEPIGVVEKYGKDLGSYDHFLDLLVKEKQNRRIVIWTYILSDDVDLLPRKFLGPCKQRKLEIALKYDPLKVVEIIRSQSRAYQK